MRAFPLPQITAQTADRKPTKADWRDVLDTTPNDHCERSPKNRPIKPDENGTDLLDIVQTE